MTIPVILLQTNCLTGQEDNAHIYINDNETPTSVKASLANAGIRVWGFSLLSKTLGYKVRPGRYLVTRGDNLLAVFRRLRNGQQDPVNLTIPSVRTIERLAAYLGEQLMMDSATGL